MERLVRWIATPVDHVPLIEAPLTQVQEKATVASIADPNDGLLMAAIALHMSMTLLRLQNDGDLMIFGVMTSSIHDALFFFRLLEEAISTCTHRFPCQWPKGKQ